MKYLLEMGIDSVSLGIVIGAAIASAVFNFIMAVACVVIVLATVLLVFAKIGEFVQEVAYLWDRGAPSRRNFYRSVADGSFVLLLYLRFRLFTRSVRDGTLFSEIAAEYRQRRAETSMRGGLVASELACLLFAVFIINPKVSTPMNLDVVALFDASGSMTSSN